MSNLIILVIFFPLFGFLSGILFGHVLGLSVLYITTFFILLSFIFSFFLLFNIIMTGEVIKIVLTTWICVDSLNITWAFYFDSVTAVMLVVVTFVSTLVHLYSTEYMQEDPHVIRFMSYLSLFTFFMLILVTANNFLQMFVGWEGVGLSSYLLINFWFTRLQANKSAIKAMLVNRVGDFFILLAMFLIYITFNSLDYDVVFTLSNLIVDYKVNILNFNVPLNDLICFFLFLGAMGKSAQLGLHVWLPDAMEGPTPVSALIHAATMVTAGVFLVTRCSTLFERSEFVLNFITIIGCITAFFASTTGLFQNDIKKVIAYSTCSQLGYMFFVCGLSNYNVGVFHLFNHAFFKALLFLGAGSIIHAVSNEQDMRKMGGLMKLLPFSYAITMIGSFALIGFPFLSGFYSKDTILEIAFSKFSNISHFSYFLGTLAAFFTAFYSTRLIYLVFLSVPNSNKVIIQNAHEASWKMSLPLFLLAILTVLIGFLTKDIFIGFGTPFWGSSIFILPKNYVIVDIEFISYFYKILPLCVTLLGIFSALVLYVWGLNDFLNLKKQFWFKRIYMFFNKKWYFDKLYNQNIVSFMLNYSYAFSYKDIDRGILEKIGPHGFISETKNILSNIKTYQSGDLFQYLFFFFLSIISIIFIIYLSQN
jgi:proton-translocating NADH-quinone oxidoreductase chain L